MPAKKLTGDVPPKRSCASRTIRLFTIIVSLPAFGQAGAVWPASALGGQNCSAPYAFFAAIVPRLEPLTARKIFGAQLGDVELLGRIGTPPVGRLVARLA